MYKTMWNDKKQNKKNVKFFRESFEEKNENKLVFAIDIIRVLFS